MKKDREISRLEFLDRLLSAAADARQLPGERLRFLTLFDKGLNEFFMVRLPKMKPTEPTKNTAVLLLLEKLVKRRHIICGEVLAVLVKKGITLLPMDALTARERAQIFWEVSQKIMWQLAAKPPQIRKENAKFYGAFYIGMLHPTPKGDELQWIKLPPQIPPLIWLDSHRYVATCEAVLAYEISKNPSCDMGFYWQVIYAYEKSAEKPEQNVLFSPSLVAAIGLSPAASFAVSKAICRRLNFLGPVLSLAYPYDSRAIETLYEKMPPALCYPVYEPYYFQCPNLFERIREKDLLLYHPYDSFQTVVDFVEEACRDDAVETICQTFYRLADPSPFVDSLVLAARKGKKVIAVVEKKARFEKERAQKAIRRLTEAGAIVISGYLGHKVHAKATLIARREETLVYYAHIGTGNYHQINAKSYTDLSYFTARPSVTREVKKFFSWLHHPNKKPHFKTLGVSFCGMETVMKEKITAVTEAAHRGKKAVFYFKVNGLCDPGIIRCLKKAAAAGVEIVGFVRGVCTWVPQSEQVHIYAVVGRFLEHSRVYLWQIENKEEVYISSADLMPRNLVRRVELLCPIEEQEQKDRLKESFARLKCDTENLWELKADGTYHRVAGKPFCAQEEEMRLRKKFQ